MTSNLTADLSAMADVAKALDDVASCLDTLVAERAAGFAPSSACDDEVSRAVAGALRSAGERLGVDAADGAAQLRAFAVALRSQAEAMRAADAAEV